MKHFLLISLAVVTCTFTSQALGNNIARDLTPIEEIEIEDKILQNEDPLSEKEGRISDSLKSDVIIDESSAADSKSALGSESAVAQAKAGSTLPATPGSPRFLDLIFSPFNPLNPFGRFLTAATATVPLRAIATLVQPSGADPALSTTVGSVLFMQKTALSPMVVVMSGNVAGLTTTTTGLLEILNNPVPSTGTTRCNDAILGTLFNPNSVIDGGIITRTATVNTARFLGAYVGNLQPNRATLFGTNSIISRSIRYSNAGADLICGNIVAA